MRKPAFLVKVCIAFHAQSVVSATELKETSYEPATVTLVSQSDAESQNTASVPLFQTKFDGFQTAPLLNIGIASRDETIRANEAIQFQSYTNYGFWIDRAEVLLVDLDETGSLPAIETLDITDGSARWTPPDHFAGKRIGYALRVYDSNDEFDQTETKPLNIVANGTDLTFDGQSIPGFYGTDATVVRNIQISGAAITVYAPGAALAGKENVKVHGKTASRDVHGDLAVQQIFPAGTHTIEASYEDEKGQTVTILRDVEIPENDWFFVGLGDLTIGARSDNGRALVEASGEEFESTFVNGRAAFYLKGKIKGKYLLTAALDTTEDDIGNIFSNLSEKDPESFLRRLDPDRFYPVYGDDSTFLEDAPTQGRFYVRLERGDDHIVWGNFLTNITQTEFAQIDRGLYGGKAEFNSDETTKNGERKVRATVFAADPGTIPAREEFRATGGSVYFLQNQDIAIGSERLRVEYRDEDSGLVVETVELQPFQDYDFDYLSGRVLLTRPLTSTQLVDQVVRDGPLSGRQTFLVARYEFSPGLEDIDGFTVGGRIEAWITDALRLGFTGQEEETGAADQRILSGDVLFRKNDNTYVKAEFARSSGQGFDESASIDGGFSFDNLTANRTNQSANAYRVETNADFNDLSSRLRPGNLRAYYENLEAGFSGPGRLTQNNTERYGGEIQLSVTDPIKVDIKYDKVSIENQLEEDTVELDVRADLSDRVNVGIGVRHNDTAGPNSAFEGERTDLGAEVRYNVRPSVQVYGFGQGTISADNDRPEANRGGIGIDARLSDKYAVRGEASGGTGGFGGQLGLTHKVRDGEEYYLNYTLDAERTLSGVDGAQFNNFLGTSQNTLTVGGRKRYNDAFSVFGEERAAFGDSSGITHAYGVDITPSSKWNIGLSFEVGTLEDGAQIIDREAYVASLGYTSEKVTFGSAFEWLQDETNGVRRDTWLSRSNLSMQVSPSWRALLRFNRAESASTDGTFFNGDFTEAQIAGAYRPINNDRFNALLRYTFFEDFTSSAQFSNAGVNALPRQRSHILKIDGNYQTTDWLTLGGKIGYRSGQVAVSRLDDDLIKNDTLLLIGRADLHLIKKWDAVAEIRYLSANLAGDSTTGALVAVYRHLGNNTKVGLGYNFTDFSDDLRDLSFNDNGVFLNIVAKF